MTDDDASQIEDARRQTIGTLGEWAVANYFDLRYHFTVNTFKAPDITLRGLGGEIWGLQVKASEYGKNFIIRPDAKDHEPYIYCFVDMPPGDPRQYAAELHEEAYGKVYIRGWMFPREARQRAQENPRLIRDPGGRKAPAIFLPVNEIHPIEILREQILGSI